jgi:amino acid adenylation domain-containing protein
VPSKAVVTTTTPRRLSGVQEQIWFEHRNALEKNTYNVPVVAYIKGPLDTRALASALQGVVARNPALRTVFLSDEGRPEQVIRPWAEFRMRRLSCPGDPAALSVTVKSEATSPFDLEHDLLFRATLISSAPNTHVLVLVAHHVVCDGWSMRLILGQLEEAYRLHKNNPTMLSGQENASADIQYLNIVAEQRAIMGDAAFVADARSFWTTELADCPEPLQFGQRLAVSGPALGQRLVSTLPIATISSVEQRSREYGCSKFVLLLAAYYLALARQAGQPDLVVGTPVSGRVRPEWENAVGHFVNMLPLRVAVQSNWRMEDLLRVVSDTVLDGLDYQSVPLAEIVAWMEIPRQFDEHPLFQAAFSSRSEAALGGFKLDGLDVTLETSHAEGSTSPKFAINMEAVMLDDRFDIVLETSDRVLSPWQARCLLETYSDLVQHFARVSRDTLLRDIPLPDEHINMLMRWSASEPAPDTFPARLDDMLWNSIGRQRSALAVIDHQGEHTYAELGTLARDLGEVLTGMGIAAGERVAVGGERSASLIGAMLALWSRDAVVVGIAPDSAPVRLRQILADSDVTAAIIPSEERSDYIEAAGFSPLSSHFSGLQLFIRSDHRGRVPDLPTVGRQSEELGASKPGAAYIIYTSGSTGVPKGVVVGHASAALSVQATARIIGIDAGRRAVQFAPLTFDASIFDIVGTLQAGGTLCIVPRATRLDPEKLLEFIAEKRVHVAHVPPSLLSMAKPRRIDTLATFCLGGEAFAARLTEDWAEAGVATFNVYGPTEATILATAGLCSVERQRSSPSMGRPLTGYRAYILDDQGLLAPPGAPGELAIGGLGLAFGYLNDPIRTAQKFLPDPFSPEPSARLYLTGDVCEWDEEGHLHFLGRRDAQVQVRGHRVELNEVTRVLESQDGVRGAAVVAVGEGNDRYLSAYVVGEEIDVRELRLELGRKLPPYMVPSHIVATERLPVSANGKVNSKALKSGRPEPSATAAGQSGQAAMRQAGSTLADDGALGRLTRLVTACVPSDDLSADDDLFAVGLTSLHAVRLAGLISHEFAVPFPVADLYAARTLEGVLYTIESDMRKAPHGPLVPLTGRSAGHAVYFVHPTSGTTHCYLALADVLAPAHRPIGVEYRPGAVTSAGVAPTSGTGLMKALTGSYANAIRDDTSGLIRLVGWSFGGIIAQEVACLLSEDGYRVQLALLDSRLPDQAMLTDADRFDRQLATLDSLAEVRASDTYDRRKAIFNEISAAVIGWRPRRFHGSALALAAEHGGGVQSLDDWQSACDDLHTASWAVGHFDILKRSMAVDLAQLLEGFWAVA